MKILLDENNYIISYVIIGDVQNGIEINIDEDIFYKPCQFYKYENNSIVFDDNKYQKYLDKQNINKEISELQKEINEINVWFEWYDGQVKQYERCVRIGEEFDLDMSELDSKAKENQLKIRNLREQIKEKEVLIQNE